MYRTGTPPRLTIIFGIISPSITTVGLIHYRRNAVNAAFRLPPREKCEERNFSQRGIIDLLPQRWISGSPSFGTAQELHLGAFDVNYIVN